MTIDALIVQPGQPIQPAWEKLRAYVDALRVTTSGSDAQVHHSPHQIDVVFDRRSFL